MQIWWLLVFHAGQFAPLQRVSSMSELLSPVNRTYALIFQILADDELSPSQDLAILTRLILSILEAAEQAGIPKDKVTQMRKMIAEVIINGGVENE